MLLPNSLMAHWKVSVTIQFLKVAHTIFNPLVSNKTAPVGQGFWSLGPQLVSAWTRCQKEAPPPRLSYSGSTFLGTPLSHTRVCNTKRLKLIGCFITEAGLMFPRQTASSNFSFPLSDLSWCLSWLALTLCLMLGSDRILSHCIFGYRDFFLAHRYYLTHKLDTGSPYRVWGTGIGSEMQRKGSKVLLCFWQWGQVSDDLHRNMMRITRRSWILLAFHFKRIIQCFGKYTYSLSCRESDEKTDTTLMSVCYNEYEQKVSLA